MFSRNIVPLQKNKNKKQKQKQKTTTKNKTIKNKNKTKQRQRKYLFLNASIPTIIFFPSFSLIFFSFISLY